MGRRLITAALSLALLLSGCASSRTFIIKWGSSTEKEFHGARQATEKVLGKNHYDINFLQYTFPENIIIRGEKSEQVEPEGWFGPHHNYRTEVRITRDRISDYRFDIHSEWRFHGFIDYLEPFRPWHRDEEEEKKLLDGIERELEK